MNQGISLIIYPVKDLTQAKKLYSTFLGVEPYADSPYYVGYKIGDQEVGLAQGEPLGPTCYTFVSDIKASLQALLDAGAQLHQEARNVGGGRLVAAVKDADGNVIGLVQIRPNVEIAKERQPMKYMLLMYWDETVMSKFTPEEFQEIAPEVWFALEKEMKSAGALVSNNGLSPVANATTLRIRDDQTLTTDGPFAETHEQLGGFYLLNCKDLDEALAWAAKIPSAKYGSIEIRPLWSEQA